MFKILAELADFLMKGIEAYASTEEGRKELEDIFQAIENVGIDLPFFDADEEDGDNLDVNAPEGGKTRTFQRFIDKHPELFGKQEENNQ